MIARPLSITIYPCTTLFRTSAQMKMFLTRLGFGSKMVITGDLTQIDLPKGAESGLLVVQKILSAVAGIEFIYLDRKSTRELQSRGHLVCRLLLEKKNEVTTQ